jgi:hypothetical protein
MARKRYKPEEIVAKLRQVDVLVSQGQNGVDAIRQIGVSEVTYYWWRQEFGGVEIIANDRAFGRLHGNTLNDPIIPGTLCSHHSRHSPKWRPCMCIT